MKTKILFLVLTAALAGSTMAAVEIDKLESSIEKLQAYEYDKTNGVDLRWVESQIALASADNSVRGKVETKLIDSLAKAKTNDAKQFLCRQLRTIGTSQCVPQLASMLTDKDISHMARYALGRIETPEAGNALYKALGQTSGKIKAGIINTLVQMEYAAAAYDITKLVNDCDKDVAIAAIRGTGRLGDRRTVVMLQRMRASAAKDMQVEIDSAILNCARRLVEKGDGRSAVEIYREYYNGKYPEHLRTAGLRGLVEASGPKAAAILVEAIKGDDPDIRRNAIAMMALIKDEKTTDTFVELCKVVPADGQELIVRSLAARGDVSAAPLIIEMTGSTQENVRLAALEALGDIGTPQAIPCLAKAAASATEREKQFARSSLARMRGDGIDKAFIHRINSGDSGSRIEVIRAIGLRLDCEPFATLHEVAKTDADDGIRREAIISMGRIGKPSDLETIVKLAIAPKSSGDRGAIKQAVSIVFNKMQNKDDQAKPVLAVLKTGPDDAKISLLSLLATPATANALKAVSAAVTSSNSKISDAAIRALGEWPNPAPVEQLYQIASSSTNQIHKILALRGYIRLTPLTKNPTACYVNALKLANRNDEIRQILGGLHHAGTRKALEIAESYMNDQTLKAEAYMAAVKVSNVYCWEDRTRVRAMLDKIIADAPNDGIRNQARNVIRKMDEYKSVIASWKGTKSFAIPGVADGNRICETAFEPEKDFNSKDIVWQMVLPEFEGGGKLDLEKTYGGIDYCCAYLRTTIHSPIDQEARLKWRVDDYIKSWLNGKPTKDGIIKLNKGANTFIVKVGDSGGGWSFVCEIVKPDDSRLEGLRFER